MGGAANVAANLTSLGAQVRLVGVVGVDEHGARLTALLEGHAGLGMASVVQDRDRPTTCKMRVMSGLHQIVRIDAESNDHVIDDIEGKVIDLAREAIDWADVVVLSDYAKGVCTDGVIRAVIDRASRSGKVSLVDPKRLDFSIYRDATLIKPNRRELAGAAKMPCKTDREAERAARVIIDQTGSAVLLTRSEQGLSYFATGEEALHLPTAAQEVFDVSGAGDTVVAMASLGLAARLPVAETMRLANVAAGIVVSKVGTAVVTIGELEAAVGEEAHHPNHQKGSLLGLAEAVRQREAWRRRGLHVGFTNGCFDLLHPGHVSLLRQAADACDRLIVAINGDASVKRLKGPARPVQTETARATVLGALSAVDLVVVFDEDTPAEAIAALQPDLLVKGADYAEDQVVGAQSVRLAGGRVMLVPLVEGHSTSALIRRSTGP